MACIECGCEMCAARLSLECAAIEKYRGKAVTPNEFGQYLVNNRFKSPTPIFRGGLEAAVKREAGIIAAWEKAATAINHPGFGREFRKRHGKKGGAATVFFAELFGTRSDVRQRAMLREIQLSRGAK
jgi:hypothetical protein